ncbi:MAG: DNA mismatch repair protein MutS [Methylothermaceae bacteria B42]|nr:MAG: DNA mismatch repair protein MutS [Methylothermaceae bacteria B42]HHJ39102.1 DNA mismatch repair protein MutS [Methylothermaceae bacterium]
MLESLRKLYPPFLKQWREGPVIKTSRPETPDRVIDQSTFEALEVEALFDKVNEARTQIGQATLHRSLSQPLTDDELISGRQEALRELAENENLRRDIEALIENAAQLEPEFYKLLYSIFLGTIGSPASPREIKGFGYEAYNQGTRFMLQLAEDALNLPKPQSAYLRQLIETLANFSKTRSHALMRGPVYRTEKRIMTADEKPVWLPAIRFRPQLFKPLLVAGTTGALLLLWAGLTPILGIAPGIFGLFLLPLVAAYPPIVGNFDRDKFIYPLRRIFREDEEIHTTLEALGYLDELLGFDHFARHFGNPATLPELLKDHHHRFIAKALRNPILGKGNPDYVPNDIQLDEHRITFITGPNSGGKTAFCKTLGQSQLLAQIGCYIPAQEAKLTVADRIFYQVPEVNQLVDGEGRFATELKHTKKIFLAATPKSLVILDELAEGTTYEERLEISYNIMEGFHKKGCTTILVTHNHELVDKFMQQGIGQAKQVEFVQDHPTYRLIDGISRVSHADRVAKAVGFSKEDIERYLKEEKS